jgi:hypothetical protein
VRIRWKSSAFCSIRVIRRRRASNMTLFHSSGWSQWHAAPSEDWIFKPSLSWRISKHAYHPWTTNVPANIILPPFLDLTLCSRNISQYNRKHDTLDLVQTDTLIRTSLSSYSFVNGRPTSVCLQ